MKIKPISKYAAKHLAMAKKVGNSLKRVKSRVSKKSVVHDGALISGRKYKDLITVDILDLPWRIFGYSGIMPIYWGILSRDEDIKFTRRYVDSDISINSLGLYSDAYNVGLISAGDTTNKKHEDRASDWLISGGVSPNVGQKKLIKNFIIFGYFPIHQRDWFYVTWIRGEYEFDGGVITCYHSDASEVVGLSSSMIFEFNWSGRGPKRSLMIDENYIRSLAGDDYRLSLKDALGPSEGYLYDLIEQSFAQPPIPSIHYDKSLDILTIGLDLIRVAGGVMTGGVLIMQFKYKDDECELLWHKTFHDDFIEGVEPIDNNIRIRHEARFVSLLSYLEEGELKTVLSFSYVRISKTTVYDEEEEVFFIPRGSFQDYIWQQGQAIVYFDSKGNITKTTIENVVNESPSDDGQVKIAKDAFLYDGELIRLRVNLRLEIRNERVTNRDPYSSLIYITESPSGTIVQREEDMPFKNSAKPTEGYVIQGYVFRAHGFQGRLEYGFTSFNMISRTKVSDGEVWFIGASIDKAYKRHPASKYQSYPINIYSWTKEGIRELNLFSTHPIGYQDSIQYTITCYQKEIKNERGEVIVPLGVVFAYEDDNNAVRSMIIKGRDGDIEYFRTPFFSVMGLHLFQSESSESKYKGLYSD